MSKLLKEVFHSYNFHKNNSNYKRRSSSVSKQNIFLKFFSLNSRNKSCSNDKNNSVLLKTGKNNLNNKNIKEFNGINLSYYQNNLNQTNIKSIPSKINCLNNRFNNFILCSKKLKVKREREINLGKKLIRVKSLINLNNPNNLYLKKKNIISVDSYETEKNQFKKLLFNENIHLSKKKKYLQYFLNKFQDEHYIKELYNAKFKS